MFTFIRWACDYTKLDSYDQHTLSVSYEMQKNKANVSEGMKKESRGPFYISEKNIENVWKITHFI